MQERRNKDRRNKHGREKRGEENILLRKFVEKVWMESLTFNYDLNHGYTFENIVSVGSAYKHVTKGAKKPLGMYYSNEQ